MCGPLIAGRAGMMRDDDRMARRSAAARRRSPARRAGRAPTRRRAGNPAACAGCALIEGMRSSVEQLLPRLLQRGVHMAQHGCDGLGRGTGIDISRFLRARLSPSAARAQDRPPSRHRARPPLCHTRPPLRHVSAKAETPRLPSVHNVATLPEPRLALANLPLPASSRYRSVTESGGVASRRRQYDRGG